MNNNRTLRTLWAIPLVGFLVLAALPANAVQPTAEKPIAAVAIHGGSVSFAPQVSFDRMELTVGGQGHTIKQNYRSGESAHFAPVDQEGYALPDGTYKWELVMSPRLKDLRPEAFSNGTVSADGRTATAATAPSGQRQSGVFTIKNGMMVDPNLVEIDAGRGASKSAPASAEAPSAAARSAEHTDRDGS